MVGQLKRKLDKVEADVESLKKRAKTIPSSSSEVKQKFPSMEWEISKDIPPKENLAKEKWAMLNPELFAVGPETDMYEPFYRVLQKLTSANIWRDQSRNREGVDAVPDFILYSENTPWDPAVKDHRNRILVDFEIKRRFNPEHVGTTVNPKKGYLSDLSKAYAQILRRSLAAFDAGKEIYYAVVTDFAYIVLWKITQTEDTIRAFHYGPKQLGGIWTQGIHLLFVSHVQCDLRWQKLKKNIQYGKSNSLMKLILRRALLC